MDISFEDGRRLCSLLWNKEDLIAKKRRFLMISLTASISEGSQKKAKRPKFLTDLYLPESYVRNDEVTRETIRTTVQRSFAYSSSGSHHVVQDYLLLLKTFKNPRKCHQEQFIHNTPISRHCLSSINNMLEQMDQMSYQELIAMNRKLRGVSVIPQFPLVQYRGKKDLLIERVKKRIKNLLSNVKEGDKLPESLFKALTIIYLSYKHRSRHIEMLTLELYPFSRETVDLHNDIIKALSLLPKVKYDELKALQALVDPKTKVPMKCFRNALRKYLMEYLFECDEISIPQEILRTLDFINRRMQTQTLLFSKETTEQEVEAVMIVSCQLKRIISSLFSNLSEDDQPCLKGFESDENIDAFNLTGTDYFLSPGDHEDEQVYGSCSNYEQVYGDYFVLTETANKRNGSSSNLQKCESEHDNDMGIKKPCSRELEKFSPERPCWNTGSRGVNLLQKVFDETALVAYKLVGSFLDKLLKSESIEADTLTKSYLNGGSSAPADLQGTEDMLKTSKENMSSINWLSN